MRDPERQNVFGNRFAVTFPDFPSFMRTPRYITIYKKIGKHDVVELYYQQFSPFIQRALKTGVPVKILYQNDKVKGMFFGYAVDSVPVTAQTTERSIKVTCVGASYPLKTKKSKILLNVTASEAITEWAKEYGLKPVVTPTIPRFGQLSLTGNSIWEKGQELANRHGYALQAIGTELHFHPIDKMIDMSMTTIPVMAFLDPFTNPQSHVSMQTLSIFKPRVGDYVEGEGHTRSDKIVYGVDPITAKPFSMKASPKSVGKNLRKDTKDSLFNSIESSIVVGSQTMAQHMAEGKAHLSRLSIPAKASGLGDPRINPWATVEIRGTGNTTDGFWIVTEAIHTLHADGRYTVDFHCATDGVGSNKPSASRPSSAGLTPVVNEKFVANKIPTKTTLTAVKSMNTMTSGGFKVTPRRWAGK